MHTRSGLLFAAASATAFGTVAILAKLAYAVGATPLPLLAVRFAAAALLLAGFRRIMRARRTPATVASPSPGAVWRRPMGRMLLLGAFGYGLESALYFAALEHSSSTAIPCGPTSSGSPPGSNASGPVP